MTKKHLNRRDARWSQFFTRFDYEILYRPGKSNGQADALTRRPRDLPEGGDDRLKSIEQVVLKPHNLPEKLRILGNGLPVQKRSSVFDVFNQAYPVYLLLGRIMKAKQEGGSLKEITVAECVEKDGHVLYQGKRYVPEGDELRL
jgi:hypothetical protein